MLVISSISHGILRVRGRHASGRACGGALLAQHDDAPHLEQKEHAGDDAEEGSGQVLVLVARFENVDAFEDLVGLGENKRVGEKCGV